MLKKWTVRIGILIATRSLKQMILMFFLNYAMIMFFLTSSVWWHHGFLQIIIVDFYRLVYVRLRLMIALQGYKIGPPGLEPPTGARNRRKATVIIWRNPWWHQTDELPVSFITRKLVLWYHGFLQIIRAAFLLFLAPAGGSNPEGSVI